MSGLILMSIIMKMNAMLNFSMNNLISKSIDTHSSKMLFNTYKRMVVIEEFL